MAEEEKIEQLKALIESRIEQLEQEIQLYQKLLEIISECTRSPGGHISASAAGKEYRSKSGKPVARLSMTRDTFRLVFLQPVPASHPYIKYVLTSLERLSENYEGLEYSFEEDNGKVTSILVTGVTKDNIDDVKAILEFAAKKIASLYH
jgi:hypothetical protein